MAFLAAPMVLMDAPRAHGAAAPEPVVDYTVVAGDTLYDLAKAYLVNPQAAREVALLNHVDRVRHLLPGKLLHLPRRLLKDEPSTARLETFSGPVSVRENGQSRAARLGEVLGEGAGVETGRNAFAALRLADGTLLALPSQSNLTISWLRKVVLGGALERDIALGAGRLRTKVVPMTNPQSRFRVITPIAVSAVRGTEFRVAYEAQGAFSAAQVDEGKVGFAAGQGAGDAGALELPPGFGAANAGGKDTGVVKLLDPPKLDDPDKIQSEDLLQFTLVPPAKAVRYHAQVARDAGFIEVIDEAFADVPQFVLPSQPADSYFLRISAYDALGLEGSAFTYSFERRRNKVSGGMDPTPPGVRRLRFRWDGVADGKVQYRFQLLAGGADGVPVVDEAGLSENVLAISNLPAGDYAWRVCSLMLVKGRMVATWTQPQSIHISK